TSDIHGGAAIAAFRLMNALNATGANAKMLVRDKFSDNENVIQIGSNIQNKRNFYWERGQIFLHNRLSKKNLFDISIANTGVSVTQHPEFKKADVIHLHWINQGMLSLHEIEKILTSGKKVVWTMHDMWPFTGICHHAGPCTHFHQSCGNCPYLKATSNNDLSRKIFLQKQSVYAQGKINFVACSQWLGELAGKSPLTKGHNVVSIPNPIDTQRYLPKNKTAAKKEFDLPAGTKVVLFAAVKASDKRKGTDYLIEASRLLQNKQVLFLIAGTSGGEIAGQLSVPCVNAGFVSPAKMPDLYNAADVFVTPSLQENLPNTIMEAMACGTPCVGFNIGGIPEMITHRKNGYVAEYKNTKDLADGLLWTLFKADYEALAANAREKALAEYAQEKIANRYLKLYAE
ncbi:MAG: glycosyltransferase family 4 protein, partial [Bacteroidia bacterium]|nr:glycosyltransferase family 4 protein [Bacteroidia bacterium]